MESNKLLVVNNHKLIIDKYTNLLTILNRKKYNKLYIKKYVSKTALRGFDNVKELTFDCEHDHLSYIINKLSFSETLEKLIFKNGKYIGTEYDSILDLQTLKTIEFPASLEYTYEKYLYALNNLKEIIFNISTNTIFFQNNCFNGRKRYLKIPNSLEKITLKTASKNYDIIPDYKIKQIGKGGYYKEEGIVLNYENDYIKTKINIKNDKVNKINKLKKINDDFIKDGCFYIPDYINSIDLDGQLNFNEINSLSLNIDILSSGHNVISDIKKFIPDLNKIIIRSNNEMNLFPIITLSEEEYGEFQAVYIKNNQIDILLDGKILTIDKDGMKKMIPIKELVQKENKEEIKIIEVEKQDNNLNNYTANQLEYYSYYKKLLELLSNQDEELEEAMEVVKDRLVKKLEINE